jgi:hypothetical protein
MLQSAAERTTGWVEIITTVACFEFHGHIMALNNAPMLWLGWIGACAQALSASSDACENHASIGSTALTSALLLYRTDCRCTSGYAAGEAKPLQASFEDAP